MSRSCDSFTLRVQIFSKRGSFKAVCLKQLDLEQDSGQTQCNKTIYNRIQDSEAATHRCSSKNGVLKIYSKFTGEHSCRSCFTTLLK